MSYWRELGTWVNSPGYDDGVADFDRPILPRCLECQAPPSKATPGGINQYNRTGFVLGVTCERCHGPGREHVDACRARLSSGPRVPAAGSSPPRPADTVNPRKLPRDRQIEICPLCHAGRALRARAPAVSYRPGEPLDDYFVADGSAPGPRGPDAELDPHGNSVSLLEKSRCFQASAMTCSTCHDVHVTQRDVAPFADKCLTCHKVEACALFGWQGRRIVGRCVDCHMPNQLTSMIVMSSNGGTVRPKVHNHWIRVYPAETAVVLKSLAP